MTKQVFEQGDSALEITPEMVEAGVSAFCDYDPAGGELIRDRVVEIFLAMWSCKPGFNLVHD